MAKKYSAEIKPYQLIFKEAVKTSRDEMKHRDIWTIKIEDNFGRDGFGEIAPIKGLSHELENENLFLDKLKEVESNIEFYLNNKAELFEFPSILFGIESAWLSYKNRDFIFYKTDFTEKDKPIPFNALVWMGDYNKLKDQVDIILSKNVSCIKLKIGGIDFDQELELLKYIRKQRIERTLTIRLDANGSFSDENALDKLKLLSEYQIHSIEQPIKAGNFDSLYEIVKNSPIDIALDEELIGVHTYKEKWSLLEKIHPHYIVIKPSLHGGLIGSEEWIFIANQMKIKFWITSALESNLGLNTIAQWASRFDNSYNFEQGLGTGDLYENNFPTNLLVQDYMLYLKK